MSTVRSRLRQAAIRPRKDIGQHFLIDDQAVTAVLNAAALTPDDTVVEIGPGPGILTPGLCQRAGQVIAIELDAKVLPLLRAATEQFCNLDIRQADVLKVDPAELPQPYVVVANLPYYITSAILKHFLSSSGSTGGSANRPAAMTLTMQAEVAERVVAGPPRMSVLAISVQLYGQPRIVERIPRTAFWPEPDVDSAILKVEHIGQQLSGTLQGLSEEVFFRVVRAGFAEKRKQLHNTLARNLGLSSESAAAMLSRAKVDSQRRAETLTIPEWVNVGKAYANRS